MREKVFYKKGWFWCCPIYFDPHSKTLGARYWYLDWLFYLVMFLHNTMLVVSSFLGINIESCYPIKITGKISEDTYKLWICK